MLEGSLVKGNNYECILFDDGWIVVLSMKLSLLYRYRIPADVTPPD
jgi:hypothetical protein